MKEIKERLFLLLAGVCMVALIVVCIKDITIGTGKTTFDTADLIIFFTLAGGNFLSWDIIGELKQDLKKINLKHFKNNKPPYSKHT